MASALRLSGGENAVERVFASAGESQNERAGQEDKLELVAADEALADFDQHNSAEHVNGKQQREGLRKQAKYYGDPTNELEEGDGWPRDGRKRDPHLTECADHTSQAEDEELLGAVSDENSTYHDTQNRQSRVQALGQDRCGRRVRHKAGQPRSGPWNCSHGATVT
jgi:predicted acyl esterase